MHASEHLLTQYQSIAQEFEPAPYFEELSPEGNEEIAKQLMEGRLLAAETARNELANAYQRADKAKFMLTSVSIWICAALLIFALGLAGARYRNRLDRRGGDPRLP